MKAFRLFVGLVALALIAAGLNLLVWRQSLFGIEVMACLGGGMALGLVWVVLRLTASRAGSPLLQGREAGALNAALGSFFFLGICVVTYALVSQSDASWDLTQEGRRELSPQTIQVLQNMDTQVEVFCFFLNVDEQLVRIARTKTERFLDQCQQHTSLLKVQVKDPQVAVATLQELGINFASPQGTVVLRAGARKRAISLTGGSPRLEERDFVNALINVLRSSEPKVRYLTGHEERDLTDTKSPGGAGGIVEVLISTVPIRLDRHPVPCAGSMSEHLDVQYLATVRADACEVMSAESDDLRWFPLTGLPEDLDGSVRALILAAMTPRDSGGQIPVS